MNLVDVILQTVHAHVGIWLGHLIVELINGYALIVVIERVYTNALDVRF